MFVLSATVLLAINYLLVRAALPPAVAEGAETGHSGPTSIVRPIEADTVAEYRIDVLNTLLAQSSVTLSITLLLALLVGWIVASRMLRPVRAMAATARRLSADNLDQRIRMQGPRDELTDLADTFDKMLDRLSASFDSQRRFVANASHELRTPLAAQRTLVEVALGRDTSDPSVRDLCGRLLAMNVRIESMIEGLLVLARSDRGLDVQEPVRLDQVAASVIDAQRGPAARAGLRIHSELTPQLVDGERVLLERLVNNLVDNAIKYNHPGGQVWLRVGGGTALRVGNTGPTVPVTSTSELFEPFRQLRRGRDGSGHGVGLGLSIVASIASAHRGSVHADPRDGGGLDVVVRLPRSASASFLHPEDGRRTSSGTRAQP
ncbi:HAMP domain-containing histidine kinase [Micromonospora sp. NBC_01699]|uniref:sensor histidine kinase n=1 Tax=Micromonospora sp. NBC_01699 TaxID=2975984 RepID=UPI002E2979F3|nr:HAMP domain-containing sensor histidine kinase [Micromonospora sp. NBC_01699]